MEVDTKGAKSRLAVVAIQRYENGMKNVAKVAVSLPVSTLKSLEKARLRLKKTRSAVVVEALQRWLEAEQLGDDDKRYVEGYLKRPESSVKAEAIARAVTAGWEKW